MPDSLIVGLVAVAGTLIGVLLTLLFQFYKHRSDEAMWYANYFLPTKYDAILKLYGEVMSSAKTLSMLEHKKYPTEADKDIDVAELINNLNHTYYMASIYFDATIQSDFAKLLQIFNEAGVHFITQRQTVSYTNKKGEEVAVVADWPENLLPKARLFADKLAVILMPERLKKLESSWNKS
jgi:hypothetical protein